MTATDRFAPVAATLTIPNGGPSHLRQLPRRHLVPDTVSSIVTDGYVNMVDTWTVGVNDRPGVHGNCSCPAPTLPIVTPDNYRSPAGPWCDRAAQTVNDR